MPYKQYRLRSLFLITALFGILTIPVYECGVRLIDAWNGPDEPEITVKLPAMTVTIPTTVVRVPDQGTVIHSGVKPMYLNEDSR